MNMATNARDKLQASIREWMRNLEEVMSKKNTNAEEASPKDNPWKMLFAQCLVRMLVNNRWRRDPLHQCNCKTPHLQTVTRVLALL
jgi:hypothetical protein